MKHFMSDLLKK